MMNRAVTATLSAFQALLIALAGLAIPLVPLTVLWMTRLDLGLDWTVFYRAAADVWLLGHGVHLTVTLDPALATTFGLPGVEAPFLLSLAPLGFALLTLALALRLGRRTVEADAGILGITSALVTFAVVTILVAVSARHVAAMPTLWRSLTLPTLIFALGLILGARGEMARSEGRVGNLTRRVSSWVAGLTLVTRAWIRTSVRGGLGVVGILVAMGAAVTAVSLVLNFAPIIGLYEGIQAGPGGGAIITLGQLTFIPNVAVWVASWFIGSGFALGVGSVVSPAETSVGPLPSLPLFGLIPEGGIPGGFVWIVVPVLIAFIVARITRPTIVAATTVPSRGRWLWASAAGVSAVSGLAVGLLCVAASGSIGPGRMSDFGPSFWITALWLIVEVFIGSVVGFLTPGRDRRGR